jgi:hypothetical protein
MPGFKKNVSPPSIFSRLSRLRRWSYRLSVISTGAVVIDRETSGWARVLECGRERGVQEGEVSHERRGGAV